MPAIEETRKALESGLKFNRIENLTKYVKAGKIGEMEITISGARKAVEKISGLATGPKYKLVNALKNTYGSQFKNAMSGFGLVMIVIDIGKDVILNFWQYTLRVITAVKFVALSIASVVYNAIRIAGSVFLKTVLMPFVGPFAWLITLLLDVGIDVIDWFVDFKAEMSKLVEWVLNQSWSTVIAFINIIKKI